MLEPFKDADGSRMRAAGAQQTANLSIVFDQEATEANCGLQETVHTHTQ